MKQGWKNELASKIVEKVADAQVLQEVLGDPKSLRCVFRPQHEAFRGVEGARWVPVVRPFADGEKARLDVLLAIIYVRFFVVGEEGCIRVQCIRGDLISCISKNCRCPTTPTCR